MQLPAGGPGDVAPEYRKQAKCLYYFLLAGFAAYAVGLFVTKVLEPPGTSVAVKTEQFTQPWTLLCFDGLSYSMDTDDLICSVPDEDDDYRDCDISLETIEDEGYVMDCLVAKPDVQLSKGECWQFGVDSFDFHPNETDYFKEGFLVALEEKCRQDSIEDLFVCAEDLEATYIRWGYTKVNIKRTVRTYVSRFADSSTCPEGRLKCDDYTTITEWTPRFSNESGTEERAENFFILEVCIRGEEVDYINQTDPLDFAGLIGQIGGFWSFVGLIFGTFFYLELEPAKPRFDKAKSAKGGASEEAGSGTQEKEEAKAETKDEVAVEMNEIEQP